jgi:hypothetical protein
MQLQLGEPVCMDDGLRGSLRFSVVGLKGSPRFSARATLDDALALRVRNRSWRLLGINILNNFKRFVCD